MTTPRGLSIAERFWMKVQKSEGCWLWTAKRTKRGYGQLAVTHRQLKSAHRISFELHRGPIPEGVKVLHACDNPPCVRPDHLFLGTTRDNAIDAANKGRTYHQRRTHCSKGHAFTPENTLTHPYGAHRRLRRRCLACRAVVIRARHRRIRDARRQLDAAVQREAATL